MKNKMLELTRELLLAILAGIAISIGGVAFLVAKTMETAITPDVTFVATSRVVGALFFTVGLFMVCVFSLNLFTGKVGFALDKKPSYIINLVVIWIGNLLGAMGVGYLLRSTRFANNLVPIADAVSNGKINDTFLSIFILAIFCNILIFLAVYGFNKFESPLFKALALFFGVSVFVLAGFEHCVANMFYFSIANAWGGNAIICILATTLGNIVGGLLLPVCFKISDKLKGKCEQSETSQATQQPEQAENKD